MPLAPGSTFGRYVVHEHIGRGGMGEVYRAFDGVLARPVALKILGGQAADSPDEAWRGARRILREARAAAALHHPNVVAVYDLGEHEGATYLAMELVRGQSLRAHVGRAGVPVERRVRWMLDVARALSAAHRAGIVHRDIKPENVMVCETGVAKVLDFGVARQVEPHDAGGAAEPGSVATITGGSSLVGTPPYMAPEQVRCGEIDGRADQFAWGVVAYELLAGKLPWSHTGTVADLVSSVLHEVPPRLCAASPDVSESVDEAVMRALAKDRSLRFATMDDLLEALAAFDPTSSDRALAAADGSGSGPRSPSSPRPVETRIGAEVESPRALAEASAGPPATATLRAGAVSDTRAPEEVTSSSMARPARRRWMWLVGVAFTGAVVSAALVGSRGARPVATGVAITDLPAPRGCNAAADAEHRRGLMALRDGSWEQAHASFERAMAADPDCASAALRLSQTGVHFYQIARAREVYQRALELRAALGERDRLLLDALDRLIRRDPSDEAGYEDLVRALSARYPGDAELASIAATYAPGPEETIEKARQALAIDPHYGDAMQMLGGALRREGRLEEATATFDRCVDLVPGAVDCVREQVWMLEEAGRCADAEARARIWLARAPGSADGYAALATALAAEGRSKAAVEEALRQRWSRLSEPGRQQQQLYEEALADALSGDLGVALQRAEQLSLLVSADASLLPHLRATLLRVELLAETGRSEEAAEIAAELLERKSAWSSAGMVARTDMGPWVRILEPRILVAARHGRLSGAEWQAARDRVLRVERSGGRFGTAEMRAIERIVLAETPAEAEEALRSMPPSLSLAAGPTRLRDRGTDAFVGRALQLAGRRDEAAAVLGASVASCRELDEPFLQQRARLWLGQVLEDKGEKAAACEAYRAVLRRWGSATPRSLTAGAARQRLATLGCAP